MGFMNNVTHYVESATWIDMSDFSVARHKPMELQFSHYNDA